MQHRMTANKRAIITMLSGASDKGHSALQIATELSLDLPNVTRSLKALVSSGDVVATDSVMLVQREPDAEPYAQTRPHYSLRLIHRAAPQPALSGLLHSASCSSFKTFSVCLSTNAEPAPER